ncbi:tyrosinase-like [Amblyraja radiata]|uniref:tyrosinase-like n=1 Tax=Amblyraja radiata TaxID=386614 RepID=UPI0014033F53|nr:tyrosinase-like [Amblyraja radiata]
MWSWSWPRAGLLTAAALLALASGQIPSLCSGPEQLWSRRCCPAWWADGSACGNVSGRGWCRRLERAGEQRAAAGSGAGGADFRLGWPGYFYEEVCECRPRYHGSDCGECAAGWAGPGCRRPHLVKRLNLWAMPEAQRDRFLDRLLQAKRTDSLRYLIYGSASPRPGSPLCLRRASIYDVFAWAHYVCVKRRGDGQPGSFAHRGPAFPCWHRAYLLFFEREMRNLTGDPDFFVPYWSWAGQPACDVCVDTIFGSSNASGLLNQASRFQQWPTFCLEESSHELDFELVCPPGPKRLIRRTPSVSGDLPSLQDVRSSLLLPIYDTHPYNESALGSFRNTLEGFLLPSDPQTLYPSMHNMVHYFCGGTMSNAAYSANDPLFLSHHAYIDKIFEMWLRSHPGNSIYPRDPSIPHGHRADDTMPPFIPVVANQDFMKSSLEFGYTYSEMTT